MNGDEAPQTAMLLTEQEWADLAEMVAHYKVTTDWVERSRGFVSHKQALQRHRALADRIIEAAS